MSKFHIGSKTVGAKGLQGSFDLKTGESYFSQDTKYFEAEAERDRQFQEYHGHRKDGHRKFATVPDVVVLKILEDHGLDLHHADFSKDPNNMRKLKQIMLSEYSSLIVNK